RKLPGAQPIHLITIGASYPTARKSPCSPASEGGTGRAVVGGNGVPSGAWVVCRSFRSLSSLVATRERRRIRFFSASYQNGAPRLISAAEIKTPMIFETRKCSRLALPALPWPDDAFGAGLLSDPH